ncbi:MAG: metalloprotease [Geodermatophilaceae bacterium]|nr:hypothetical protein [Geodermatophilaceae bacterium]
MRRILLSPAWLIGHLLALAAVATCLRLGWWQLARFESATGSVQNAGYALQWPVFGVFVLVFWAYVIRTELRPPAADAKRPDTPVEDSHTRIVIDEQSDPELAAYNRYLAELHAADTGSKRPD